MKDLVHRTNVESYPTTTQKMLLISALRVVVFISTVSAASSPVVATKNKNWIDVIGGHAVCPMLKCPCNCEQSDFQKDENGCRTCICVDPCECKKCPRGMSCDAAIVACDVPPCPPSFAYCWKAGCPSFSCDINCEFGYENDKRQCPVCKCDDPCKVKYCPIGTVCQPVMRDCYSSKPCVPPSVAQCTRACCPRWFGGTGSLDASNNKKMPASYSYFSSSSAAAAEAGHVKCRSDKQCAKIAGTKCCPDPSSSSGAGGGNSGGSSRHVCTHAVPCLN